MPSIEFPADVFERYKRLKSLYDVSDAEMLERMLKGVSTIAVNRKVLLEVWSRLEGLDERDVVDGVVKREFEWLLEERADVLSTAFVKQLQGTIFWLSVVRWLDRYTSVDYKAFAGEVSLRLERNWRYSFGVVGYADVEWSHPQSSRRGVIDVKHGQGDVLYQSQLAVERVRYKQCKLKGLEYAVVVSGYQFPAREDTQRKLEESVGKIYMVERYAGLSEIFGGSSVKT